MLKKGLALIVTVVMVLTMVPAAVFAADTPTYSDMPNDWSKTALENAVKNGLITGYPDATIRAGKSLSRAEMVTIVAKAFGATTEADISRVQDVKSGDWYYSYIAKSIGMEGMAFATVVRPKDAITREEAFTVLNKVMLLMEGQDVDKSYAALNKYSDVSNVSNYARGFVNEMSANGYVTGNTSGRLNPKGNITRAEFAAVMDNMFKEYIAAPTAQTKPVSSGNVVITSGGALKDVTINGDLVLADGIGNKEVKLENVTIKGRLVVRGGSKIEFTGKVEKDILVWAKNCTVYANSGKDSFRESIVLERATGSRIVLPGTGSGGGGGGSSSVKKDYNLGIQANVIVGGSDYSVTALVPYAPSEKISTVINNAASKTKDLVGAAYDKAIKKGVAEGFLTKVGNDYIINHIGVPVDSAITDTVLDSVKEQITLPAGNTVLDDLVSGTKIELTEENIEVLKELQTKLSQYKASDLHTEIENHSEYKQYLDMLGSDKAEQIAALERTMAAYSEQIGKILNPTAIAARVAEEKTFVYYLEEDENKLQTYVIIDPIKVADDQFDEYRKKEVEVQFTDDSKALKNLLDVCVPSSFVSANSDGYSKLLSKDSYMSKYTNIVRKSVEFAKDWEPVGRDRKEFISRLIAKLEAKGKTLSEEEQNALYYLSGAKPVEGVKNVGVNMTMKELRENLLGQNMAEDDVRTIQIPSITVGDVLNQVGGAVEGMEAVMDWLNNYSSVGISGTMTIHLNQQAK